MNSFNSLSFVLSLWPKTSRVCGRLKPHFFSTKGQNDIDLINQLPELQEAIQLMNRNKATAAETLFLRSKQVISSYLGPHSSANIKITQLLINCYYVQGKWEKLLAQFDSLEKVDKDALDRKARLLLRLGRAFEAISVCEAGLDRSDQSSSLYSSLLSTKSCALTLQQDSSARDVFEELLRLSEGSDHLHSQVYRNLGVFHWIQRDNYNDAISSIQSCLDLLDQSLESEGSSLVRAGALAFHGEVLMSRSEFENALQKLQEALNLSQKVKSKLVSSDISSKENIAALPKSMELWARTEFARILALLGALQLKIEKAVASEGFLRAAIDEWKELCQIAPESLFMNELARTEHLYGGLLLQWDKREKQGKDFQDQANLRKKELRRIHHISEHGILPDARLLIHPPIFD